MSTPHPITTIIENTILASMALLYLAILGYSLLGEPQRYTDPSLPSATTLADAATTTHPR